MSNSINFRQRLHRFLFPILGLTFMLFAALAVFAIWKVMDFEDRQAINSEIDYIAQRIVQPEGLVPERYEWDEPHHQLAEEHIDPFFVRVFDAQGRFVYQSDNILLLKVPYPAQMVHQELYRSESNSQSMYIIERAIFDKDHRQVGFIQIGRFEPNHGQVVRWLGISLIGIALLIFAIWWVLLRSLSAYLTKPLSTITAYTEQISSDTLGIRLPVPENSDAETLQLTHTLNDLLARLEHSFDDMRHFTSHAAHELQTPLTALLGNVEVALRRERTPEAYKKSLETIKIETQGMAQMVRSLLDLVRLDQSSSIPHSSFNLTALVQEVSALFEPSAQEKGLTFQHDLTPSIMIEGNIEQWRTIIFNLLDNALKYTSEGSIKVSLTPQELRISDTGRGIHAKDLPFIGKRFFRATSASDLQGNGLGWALIAEILKRHQVEWHIDSSFMEGTTVVLDLNIIQ
jgi:signal transduction histidine kinase